MVTFWDRPLAENAYIVPNDALLQQLQRALNGKNIAAITGPYGVGKTFLARQYAERYSAQYPGGIRYCGTPLEFQHAVESLPPHRSGLQLIVADELTSLCYGPNAEFDRSLARFTALLQRTDVHLLCIGNPVPPQFLRHAAAFALDGFDEPQALAFLLANAPAFGLSQAQVSLCGSTIFRQSEGNPRRMLQLLQLIASGEADFPPVIETVPGLIGLDGKPLSEQSAAYGQIRADLCCANAQVLQYFYQDPEQLYRLSGPEFESFTAAILERLGYTITPTPQTHDGGIDLFAARKDGLGTFLGLIQCKKKQPSRPVGICVVRELYGVLQARRATFAAVFTTSYFSKPAQEFQQQLAHQLSLVDFQAIQAMLAEVLQKPDVNNPGGFGRKNW